jgi:surfactin synthase thioesterase subunit
MNAHKSLVLLIHGFGSSSECWAPLLKLLAADERITSRYDFATWDYPTKWVELNLFGRIPSLHELGRSLATELELPRYRGRELTLVGHSQGGLVIQSYLAEELGRGCASALRNIRQVIFFATPTEGSTTGMSLRLFLSTLIHNPQEVTLRVLNPVVSDIRGVIRERVVGAVQDTDVAIRIPIHSFCGLQDDIVVEASARSVFNNVRSVKGNHFTIIQPANDNDSRYTEFAELLLEPGGHSHRFEIERYVTHLCVEPRERQEIRTSSALNPRTVQYDNIATLKRTVSFAASNRCKHNYVIQYGTRGNGYVVGHPSHPNVASPADIGRADDTGTFYRFEFIPEYGEEYCLNLDIYNGYAEGARNVHFHLGDHSYYRAMTYVLDLAAYADAGYAVDEPQFFLDPKDVQHNELCAERAAREPLPAIHDRPAVYRWELQNVRQGVVDIVWNVKPPS